MEKKRKNKTIKELKSLIKKVSSKSSNSSDEKLKRITTEKLNRKHGYIEKSHLDHHVTTTPSDFEISQTLMSDFRGPLHELVEGEYKKSEDGEVFITQEKYPLDTCHGIFSLNSAFGINSTSLRMCSGDVTLDDFNIQKALFIDTETTGLSLSTGTYIFLVGLGYFTRDEFVLEQYFMPRYEDELLFVNALATIFKRFSSIVSFNGKHYDVPLLKNRFIMNMKPFPLAAVSHLDLLHCARKLWRKRLRWCNLINLEKQLLGIERSDDVSGALIPTVYKSYQENGCSTLMANVFKHNKLDILSMVSLVALVKKTFQNPDYQESLDPIDLFSLGKILLADGKTEKAVHFFIKSSELISEPVVKCDVMKVLSLIYKRSRDYEMAVTLWEQMIELEEIFDSFPYEEIAKYLEHIEKNYNGALTICHEAMSNQENCKYLVHNHKQEIITENFLHRMKRLIKKSEKQ